MNPFKKPEVITRILNLLYREDATYQDADEIIKAVQFCLRTERSEMEYERYTTEDGETHIRSVCTAINKTVLKHEVITAEEFMKDD